MYVMWHLAVVIIIIIVVFFLLFFFFLLLLYWFASGIVTLTLILDPNSKTQKPETRKP